MNMEWKTGRTERKDSTEEVSFSFLLLLLLLFKLLVGLHVVFVKEETNDDENNTNLVK